MFGLGASELLILLGIIVLLFGASRLPKLAASVGEAIRELKSSSGDRQEVTAKLESQTSRKGGPSGR